MTAPAPAGHCQPAYRDRVEAVLRRVLPPEAGEPARLHQAMRYAVLGDGKRIRPLLVYATAGANCSSAGQTALAGEGRTGSTAEERTKDATLRRNPRTPNMMRPPSQAPGRTMR